MGSKKEHKHKKESKHKHKRRHRYSDSDERSRSPSVKRKRHDRERDHKSRHERDRENSEERQSESRNRNGAKIKTEQPDAEVIRAQIPEEPVEEQKSESLSIDETNKIRAKLGLKPLDIGNSQSEDGVKLNSDENFVHAPAEDLAEKKKQEKLREKIMESKKKREIAKKMSKVRTLGEVEEDSAADWVVKSRMAQQQREQDEKMMKLGDEFGVSDLIKTELGSKSTAHDYTERDLAGLSVEHSLESFREGRNEILVIKDKEILGSDEEDVLHSLNVDDVEKSKKNMEIKRRGVGYKAYEEEEIDDMGFFKAKVVLGKYDEEIEGEQITKFKIGASGKVDASWVQQKEEMKQEIRAKGESLSLPPLKLANEYLTEEDMRFKKRKRKVKKSRKREVFKADDLLPLPGSSEGLSNHGSRFVLCEKEQYLPSYKDKSGTNDGESSQMNNKDERNVIEDDDDAINDLQRALDKSRRAKQKKADAAADEGAQKVAQHLHNLTRVKLEKPDEQFTNTLFLNATDEFCRQLAQVPVKQEVKQVEDMDLDEDNSDEDDTQMSKWSSVNPGQEVKHTVPTQEVEVISSSWPILPKHNFFLSLETHMGNSKLSTTKKLFATIIILINYYFSEYCKIQKKFEKTNQILRITVDFTEKKDYKPQISIEYVDEKGRNLSAKEAFRKLSHRFHGKGSGKMKQEKRMKKLTEQETMLHMSSTDTPLNTVAMMKEKQRSQSSPYIVLSGAGKTLVGGSSSVKK
uniref:U4/U6.U5 tri-snRNP-associated protein 1 n=1 Tax=Ciona savignyi TaxID=51511 RepID=H2ZE65_CIOSA